MTDEEAIYQITPKGIAILAMLDVGLITSMDDKRFDKFWDKFCDGMINAGYVERGDDQ